MWVYLPKLPSNSTKHAYSYDGHTSILVDIGFVFLLVAHKSVGRGILLERLNDDFKRAYGARIGAKGLNPVAVDDDDDLFGDTFRVLVLVLHTILMKSSVFLLVAHKSVGRGILLERLNDDFKIAYGVRIGAKGLHPVAVDDDDDLFGDTFSLAYNLDEEFGVYDHDHAAGRHGTIRI
ncbi:vesicle-associated membrane protein [Thalictrum thalictroides]|uniref:Vesicle-associated membrane protein n=1 Tax=Thalictrum thalictroides TaxID=46969 RepID=A0A7J6VDB7_THATH|nr:vesicle-associated membrane protein [Thalictrum thalictroides]